MPKWESGAIHKSVVDRWPLSVHADNAISPRSRHVATERPEFAVRAELSRHHGEPPLQSMPVRPPRSIQRQSMPRMRPLDRDIASCVHRSGDHPRGGPPGTTADRDCRHHPPTRRFDLGNRILRFLGRLDHNADGAARRIRVTHASRAQLNRRRGRRLRCHRRRPRAAGLDAISRSISEHAALRRLCRRGNRPTPAPGSSWR